MQLCHSNYQALCAPGPSALREASGPSSLCFLPPPPNQPTAVIFLMSWKAIGKGLHSSRCHCSCWPGSSVDNTSSHPQCPSLPLRGM
jgi:hypothetical protein